jgi:hypothetical protein
MIFRCSPSVTECLDRVLDHADTSYDVANREPKWYSHGGFAGSNVTSALPCPAAFVVHRLFRWAACVISSRAHPMLEVYTDNTGKEMEMSRRENGTGRRASR